MLRSRSILRACGFALLVSLAACAAPTLADENSEYTRLPRDIRIGATEMLVERVMPDVSREEVAAAVQALVERETMCFPWPGLWLDASNRRSFYYARFDLMARDWGQDVADASRARMQEFVELGFLIARERPDIGAGVVEYTLTTDGVAYLRGSPYAGERPSFCAPSQRRVVEITAMEWGDYPCGSLRVRFNHVADDWPTWARNEGARIRIASTWAPVGVEAQGSVSLNRQWYRPSAMPPDMQRNGELRSLCYDASRQRVAGEDLELGPVQP